MVAFGLGKGGGGNDNDNGASSSGSVTIDSSTPWMAASEGNLSLLQSSITSLQLTFNAADENGYTLLHAAASYNQLDILRFLLLGSSNTQVNVNAVDNDGDSALHYSTKVDAAKLLIDIGKINPSITNSDGKTALQAKQDEINEMMQDDDVDDDDEEMDDLKTLVEYLSTLSSP